MKLLFEILILKSLLDSKNRVILKSRIDMVTFETQNFKLLLDLVLLKLMFETVTLGIIFKLIVFELETVILKLLLVYHHYFDKVSLKLLLQMATFEKLRSIFDLVTLNCTNIAT